VHQIVKASDLVSADVLELIEEAKSEGHVTVSGPGLSATLDLTWTGRKVLEAALTGKAGINVHGGNVQIGDHNHQQVDELGLEDDDGTDGAEDDEDDDEIDDDSDDDDDDFEDDDDDFEEDGEEQD